MIDPDLIDDAPSVTARMLRQFAAVWLVFFAGLSAWNVYRGRDGVAIVFAALALAAGPLGLVRPLAIRPLFSVLSAVTRPIGLVMTRVILGVLFYFLFTPVALVFKVIGRDALSRERSTARNSYWMPRSLPGDARRYFRQY